VHVTGDRSGHAAISFGPFRLLPKARLLEKDGVAQHIGGRALDILILLAERAGEVVSKRELVDKVWADVTVDEGSLRFHVTALRKVLGDNAADARYVLNIPGRGYSFAAAVTRGDAARFETPRTVRPSSPPPEPLPRRQMLPGQLTRIIGREETIQELLAELKTHRFVSVVGPGGIGKTSVALAAGHRLLSEFEDNIFFIDFSSLRDPHLVASAVANALGLTVNSDNPAPSLLDYLRNRRMFLILDSCEHVLESLAVLAESLIREASDLHILATSRESFRVEGEQVYRLFPLACPPQRAGLKAAEVMAFPAAQLFVERITACLGQFELADAEAPLVAEICTRLDGIALAIELAAGRVDAYGIGGIASQLGNRLSLLWQGRRTAVPRHQTLSAALSWSYDLLPEAEATTLRRMSVFVGPFTLDAAIAVASDDRLSEGEAVDAIANLVAKSLISAPPGGERMRYRLLDTTRAFVAGKLAENNETDVIARRHVEYVSDVLEDVAARSASGGPGFIPHAVHLPNVRAALDWCFSERGDRALAIRLAAAAAQFFLELTLLTECYRWTQQAIAALDAASSGGLYEMELQAALGVSEMFTRGNTPAVRTAFDRSLALAEKLGDAHWQLWMLRGLHIYLTRIGDFEGALQVGERGNVVAKLLGDPASTLTVEWMLGVAEHLIGHQHKAVVHCASAMTNNPNPSRTNMLRLGYDDRIVALVAYERSLWLTGRPDRAVEAARYTIREAERLEQPLTLGIALVWTIYVYLWVGDWNSSGELVDRLIDHAARHFLGPYHAVGIGLKGALSIRRGEAETGIDLLRRCLATLQETRHQILMPVFMTAMAEGLSLLGRHDEALTEVGGALAQVGTNGESFDLADMMRVKGAILAQTGRLEEAETTLRQSMDLARRQGALGWELRTALTLARLWQDSGRSKDAYALIAPLHARYKEGLQTLDLKAAKTLLDELGRARPGRTGTKPRKS
jgi:predicted ATPase/DNA-binding winged helix-turn-helix (wHTH) protein